MAEYINTNEHGVVVGDKNSVRSDKVTRVASGQSVEASGDFEQNLKNVDGVVPANSDEGKQYSAAHPSREPGQEAGLHSVVEDAVATRLSEARAASAAGNNVVRGDDEAPLGPDTGTITTKMAVQQVDDQRGSIADHEALPSDVEGKAVTDVAVQQAKDTQAAEELAQKVLDEGRQEGIPERSSRKGGRSGRAAATGSGREQNRKSKSSQKKGDQ